MYITNDDYLKFTGVNLEIEFKNGNYDIADPVPVFIEQVETRVINRLKYYYDNDNFEDKINKKLDLFKKGLMFQIQHNLTYGIDSGRINEDAFNCFAICGLCNIGRC